MSDIPGFAYCLYCKEPIMEGEAGTHMAGRIIHVDCFIRIIMGGFNHIMKVDKCFGGALDADNEGLSLREAAREARRAYQWVCARDHAQDKANKLPDCD